MFSRIEKTICYVRNIFWEYPDVLFFGQTSIYATLRAIYLKLRPFSHIASSILIIFVIGLLASNNINILVSANNDTLIEGVLVGVDENGNMNSIQKVNPLVITNIQIEKDIDELIYESLVRVDKLGQPQYVLVEAMAPTYTENKDYPIGYRVKLKEGIKWHDGTDFTAKDVEATFKLLEKLNNDASTQTIYSTVANKRIKYVPIEGDDYRFEFQLEGVVPNFYELISFKILPAKYIESLNSRSILTSEPYINSHPIGTGKYKLGDAGKDYITLQRNDDYYDKENIPKIREIKFQFFINEEEITDALRSGQIHSAAGFSTNTLSSIKSFKNLKIYSSDVVYTQYYGIYFNLSESGPAILKEVKVRQAISSAINRNYIVDILEGSAEEAYGPIPVISFAYADNEKDKSQITRYLYNVDNANKLLDEAGWTYQNGDKYRSKDGVVLEFKMISIDNIDRNKVSDSIVSDLAKVGIKVDLIRKSNRDAINENVLSRNFDTLLYGMTTFRDPDRYELFHSSQILHPGLNISSYISTEETLKVVTVDGKNKTEKVPEVDYRLEEGRSFLDEKRRLEEYYEFQRIVAEEVPMVFLYHPELNYTVNKRVKGVNISDANSLEERFMNVEDWNIEL